MLLSPTAPRGSPVPSCPRCSSELSEDESPCQACGFDPLEAGEDTLNRAPTDPATMKAISEALDAVSRAVESGLDVANAQAEVTEAQEALADGDQEAARDHAVEAKRLAEDAKRYARASSMVERTQRELERLAREGIDLTKSNAHLAGAQESLARGVYGEVQELVRLARESATEAKRRGAAVSQLQREEARVQAEARRGVDISRVLESLNASQVAITTMNAQEFRKGLQGARLELKIATERKKLEDACLAVKEELQDLQRQGAATGAAEGFVKEALDAGDDVREAWQALGRARRAVKSAREHLNREVVASTVQRIVEHASRGDLTSGQARDLIREVQDALEKGQAPQVESMIADRLQSRDVDRIRATSRSLQDITERLLMLRRAEIELLEADPGLQEVKAAIDAGRFEDADRVLTDLHETTNDMLAVVRESTQAMVLRAAGQIQVAADAGLDTADTTIMLDAARSHSEQGRLPEAIELAKSAEAQASSLITEQEARRREEEFRKGADGRLQILRARVEKAREDTRVLGEAGMDCRHAVDLLSTAEAAGQRGVFDEAERGLTSAESLLGSLWAALRREAQNTLERARQQASHAELDQISDDTRTLLQKAEQAFEGKHYRMVVELGDAFMGSLQRARQERAAERTRLAEERAKHAQEEVTRVRALLQQVKTVMADAVAVDEMERALDGVSEGSLDKQVSEVERIASRLAERLRASAEAAIETARRAIQTAADLGANVDDAQLELELGRELAQKGDWVAASKHARGAQSRAETSAERRRQDLEAERRRRVETARAMIARMKTTMEDLGRADIQMEGGGDAIRRAQRALDDSDFAAVESILEPFNELSASLTEGLKHAAETFLHKEQVNIMAAQTEGLDIPRAEKVLATAQSAVTEEKFVEALEYHKVIADIIQDARRQRELARMGQELETLRKELGRGVTGVESGEIGQFLDQAEEHMKKGSFEQFRTEVKKAREVLDAARRALIAGRLERMSRDIAAAKELGAEIPMAEELFDEAKLAAAQGDFGALVEFGDRVAEISDQARRKLLRARSVKDLREVREIVEEAAKAGMDVAEARAPLEAAEEALQEGAYDSLADSLDTARNLVAEVRRKHYEEVYGQKLQVMRSAVAEAASQGVGIPATEAHLAAAATAIAAGDFESAELSLGKAQVDSGREIQRWLANRHPDLRVHVQELGLQTDRWNPLKVEVENRGAVAAQDVRLALRGDADLTETPAIPVVGPGAKVAVALNVRPKGAGRLPLQVVATYRRVLDDTDYTAGGEHVVTVQGGGTYLVEDVFIIHVDGRLLFHVGGSNREIDEDIFSGMLSVVQDFVRDAFQATSGKGLRRFEFGHYKVLIERSAHLFVAVKIAGQEPELLALYMAEILRDAEARYGKVLENWGGLLNEVGGIEDLARKLLLVTDAPEAPLGELEASPVTAAFKAMQRARELGADDHELQEMLSQAKSSVEADVEIAWKVLGQAQEVAHRAEGRVDDRMGALISEAHSTVGELRSLGADMGQGQVLLSQAEQALGRKEYGRVREITDHLRRALDTARVESSASALQAELKGLLADLERCKAQHMHVNHIEEALVSVQEVVATKDVPRAQTMLRRARQLLEEEKGKSASQGIRDRLATLAKLLHDAAAEGLALPEVQELLSKATSAVSEGREGDARLLLEAIEENVRPKVKKYLVDHYPRLFLHFTRPSFQLNEAAKCHLELENRGNTVAVDVDLDLSGAFSFGGVRKVGRLAPGERRGVSFRAEPRSEGASMLDLRVRYRRPLEEAVHNVVDSREVFVHGPRTYPVERALLYDLRGGALQAQEARTFLDREDHLVDDIAGLLKRIYPGPEAVAFRRVPGEGATLILERAGDRVLAVVCDGDEPAPLPLFMVDALRRIAEENASVSEELAKLLWVSADPEAQRGPLEDSPILSAVILIGGDAEGSFLRKARGVIEERDFDDAVRFLARAEETTVISKDELRTQLNSVLSNGEAGAVSEEEMGDIVDLVKRVLTAVSAARKKLGVHARWPLRKIAVRAEDAETFDLVTSFKKLLTGHTLARDFEILRPRELWRGMRIELAFHPEHMNRIYKSWAKRVELMLKRQDPWKIKAGVDKGEYSVGIEGQKVTVHPEAVSFQIGLPERCAEEPFAGGVVYVDGTADAGIEGEGLARELIAALNEERTAAGVPAGELVEATVEAEDQLPPLLKDWLGLVKGEAKLQTLGFGKVKKGGAHPVGKGQAKIAIVRAGKVGRE